MFKQRVDIEIKAIKNASHVLVCSERDRQKILSKVPEINGAITVIPNCVNINDYINYKRINDENASSHKFNILFIGLLSYFPNADAVHSICTKIAPNMDDKFEFIIVGKNPPIVKKPDNVTFSGYVDDIKKYISKSDICIAPLRYGSGTRLKILEYMAMGKPVISTSKGAEGIDYTNGENIIIEDDIEMFPERIFELIEKNQKREELGKRAQQLVGLKYNWSLYQEKLIHIYEGI
jgi:glycosyltransferase involved in cell wall biosynthesis